MQGAIFHLADIQIGFQNASYTFTEPQFETEIFGVVLLEKQNNRITEQSYVVIIGVNAATPPGVCAATLSSVDEAGFLSDNDYVVNGPDVTTYPLEFGPDQQLLEFSFTLFPDMIAEGMEAFQASSLPTKNPLDPSFTAPSAGGLFPYTFIIIADDDRKFGCIIFVMFMD